MPTKQDELHKAVKELNRLLQDPDFLELPDKEANEKSSKLEEKVEQLRKELRTPQQRFKEEIAAEIAKDDNNEKKE